MKSDGKPEAADRGRGTGEAGPGGSTGFDGLDHGLIHALQLDGRAPFSCSAVQWLVRVQCTPDAAAAVAEALARRPDTSWVSLMSGGTEISAMCRAARSDHSEALLLQKLPRTPSVIGVTAHCQLHQFFGGPQGLINKSGALTDEQIARPGVRAMESAPRIRHIKGPGPVFPSPRPAPGRHR
ncbi:hypothetical protein OHU45_37935 [Streptomyces tubercidicus]|uniref:hypothetical protein n=1 Tax=Streptomyces tubercidicus TaxID=47759 RepID=UPI0037580EE8